MSYVCAVICVSCALASGALLYWHLTKAPVDTTETTIESPIVDADTARDLGLREKSAEFLSTGAEVYVPSTP